MIPTKEISRLAHERFAAYETGDALRALDIYSDDVVYWDTKTAQRVEGKAALARHLGNFLDTFDVKYAVLEEHRLDGQDAAIVLWECAVRRRGADRAPEQALTLQRGMNILFMREGLITREESYNDRASLDKLPMAGSLQ